MTLYSQNRMVIFFHGGHNPEMWQRTVVNHQLLGIEFIKDESGLLSLKVSEEKNEVSTLFSLVSNVYFIPTFRQGQLLTSTVAASHI